MLSNWIKELAFLAMFLTIISIILPSGKLGVYIKSMFAIAIFSVILKPLIFLKEEKDFFPEFSTENEAILEDYQDDYLSMIMENKNLNNKNLVEKVVSNYGISNFEIEIEYIYPNGTYKIINCTVKIKEYFSNNLNKDINVKIINDISICLSIDKTLVEIIYE